MRPTICRRRRSPCCAEPSRPRIETPRTTARAPQTPALPGAGEPACESARMEQKDQHLSRLRHTAAHVLAHAVVDLFGPKVKLAIGPAIDNGFYYDFLKETPFSPEDLPLIEARMLELIAQGLTMRGRPITREAAAAYYVEHDQPFKLE